MIKDIMPIFQVGRTYPSLETAVFKSPGIREKYATILSEPA